ncbi:GNAT family N-acetyltransferase [Streptomyces litchfieldiae]|uniref:N-acetyltransferase n=1 Tax=Streptomyces litchfieldiae TaxID=3075543 RepID=A0ABU2MTP8_9ACTN|nr:N-acetyltransferase [Streptomyces sp. DSM 44938]MDT0344905.1 N-acetyltransferase [Streptomyces sp. DSM 44938]
MLIRRETPADPPAIHAVTAAAFARPDGALPMEARLVDEQRRDEGWLPALSLVATDPGGEVIGHVVCTRGRVGAVPALGLGPLSVRPDRQRRGVGLGLMHAVLGAADALGEPLVALLGSPDYYGRYGFRTSTEYGIDPPDPKYGKFFQVRTLAAYDPAVTGVFQFCGAFERL